MITAKDIGQPDPSKKLLREKISRRAALVNAIEDMNIQILALTGEIRWLDQEIEMLTDQVKIDAIAQAKKKFEEFEKKESARLEEEAPDLEHPVMNP